MGQRMKIPEGAVVTYDDTPGVRQKIPAGAKVEYDDERDAQAANALLGRKKKSPAEIQAEAQRLQTPVEKPSLLGEIGSGLADFATRGATGLSHLPKDLATSPLALVEGATHPGAALRSGVRGYTAGISDATMERPDFAGGEPGMRAFNAAQSIMGRDQQRLSPEQVATFREEDRAQAPHSEFVGAMASPLNKLGPVAGPAAQGAISTASAGGDLADVVQGAGLGAAVGGATHAVASRAAPAVRKTYDRVIRGTNAGKAIALGAQYGAEPRPGPFGQPMRGGPFEEGGDLAGLKAGRKGIGQSASREAAKVDQDLEARTDVTGSEVGHHQAMIDANVREATVPEGSPPKYYQDLRDPIVPMDTMEARLQRLVDKNTSQGVVAQHAKPYEDLLERVRLYRQVRAPEPDPATADTMLAIPRGPRRETSITQALPVSERAGSRIPGESSRKATLDEVDSLIKQIEDYGAAHKKNYNADDAELMSLRSMANELRGSGNDYRIQGLADARTRHYQEMQRARDVRALGGQKVELNDSDQFRGNLTNKMIRQGTDTEAEGVQQDAMDLLRHHGYGQNLDMPLLLRRASQNRFGIPGTINPLTIAATNANALLSRVGHPLTRDISRPVPSLIGAGAAEVARKRKRRPE